MKTRKGFTLVEILIVVVILGILAAIVIPQFTEASTEAKASRLASDLQMLRSQIELYKVQHNDRYPGYHAETGSIDEADFWADLTGKTDAEGNANDSGPFGPYIQKVPSNPFVTGDGADDVTIGEGTDGLADCETGWYFDSTTGKIYAGDADHQDL